jgi:hypothetical protein
MATFSLTADIHRSNMAGVLALICNYYYLRQLENMCQSKVFQLVILGSPAIRGNQSLDGDTRD